MIGEKEVQQLAMYGSFQVPKGLLEVDFGKMTDALKYNPHINPVGNVEFVDNILPGFKGLLTALLELSGYPSLRKVALTRSSSAFTPDDTAPMHRDYAPMGVSGFSVLISEPQAVGRNHLQTAGRSYLPFYGHFLDHDYGVSPVVMAQREFGSRVTDMPTGATWHRGSRDVAADFLAIEVGVS